MTELTQSAQAITVDPKQIQLYTLQQEIGKIVNFFLVLL